MSDFKKVKPGFCKLCGKRIVLVPSAKERAEKHGGTASDYTRMFTTHSDCLLKYRDGK